MGSANNDKTEGLLLLREMLQLVDDLTKFGVDKVPIDKVHTLCIKVHIHLMCMAVKPGNKNLCDYLDTDGETVKERLLRQASALKAVSSGVGNAWDVLSGIRTDISHSNGMKQLLVSGGPFADEISDAAKLAGFALKLTSGTAYENSQEAASYGVDDAISFLHHVVHALG